jgi:hypothetical protein
MHSASIPTTQEKIEQYLSVSKPKLTKLVQVSVDVLVPVVFDFERNMNLITNAAFSLPVFSQCFSFSSLYDVQIYVAHRCFFL